MTDELRSGESGPSTGAGTSTARQLVELVRDGRLGPLAHVAFGSLDVLTLRRHHPRPMAEEALTGFEALSWKLEAAAGAGLRPDFTNVTVLAGFPDLEEVRERVSALVQALPQLRQRVQPPRWSGAAPTWQHDPWFHVDDHLDTVTCPLPGSLEQLLDLAERVTATPFPSDRPLWKLTLVEGLGGGRTALVQHVHHAVTDGAGGVRALGMLFGTDTDVRSSPGGSGRAEPPSPPRFMAALGRLAGACLCRTIPPVGPASAVSFAREQFLLGRRPASRLLAPRSPSQRRFGAHSLHLDRVRRTARVLGGSRNDLLVCGLASALGDYHRRMGQRCEELRVAVPVLRRHGHRQIGRNDVTVVTLPIPTGPVGPDALFRAVRERLVQLLGNPALPLSDLGLDLLGTLPAPLVATVAAAHTALVDVVTSAVPGMRRRGDLGGATVEASYPFGPRVGAALNVTSLRCHDRIDLGLNVDPTAITEPDLFLGCLVEAFETLFEAGGAGTDRSTFARVGS